MNLPHPLSITPDEALSGIAEWYGVTSDVLERMVDKEKSPAVSIEHARIQFVYAHMCRIWQEWFQSERLDV